MTDPSARISAGGSSRALRQRAGVRRNVSGRSSAVLGDDLLQTPGYGSVNLRSTASRFSLNEQFAATRREIDFGFDDSSSILERSTLASEAFEGDVEGDGVFIGRDDDLSALQYRIRADRDSYELLCLPRNPTPSQVRRAYYRLLTLLYPVTQSQALHHVAQSHLEAVQEAFETLIDPCRQSRYLSDGLQHLGLNADDEDSSLNVRFGGQDLFPSAKSGTLSRPRLLKPLDFSIGQTLTTPLPVLGELIDQALRVIQGLQWPGIRAGKRSVTARRSLGKDHGVIPGAETHSATTLSARAHVYGFLQDGTSLPANILTDPYQPSMFHGVPRQRAFQLHDGRMHPLVTLKLQHRIRQHLSTPDNHRGDLSTPDASPDRDLVLEAEADIIPDLALGVRVSKGLVIPGDTKTSIFRLSTKAPLWRRSPPRLGLDLQRPTAGGLFTASVDSGNWARVDDITCNAFSHFSRINRKLPRLDLPLSFAPKTEIGYTVGSQIAPSSVDIFGNRSNAGLRNLDWALDYDDRGSWKVLASTEPGLTGLSLTYAIDARLPLSQPQPSENGAVSPALGQSSADIRGVRLETELASNSIWASFLALRCLKRVGRFSKVGFEVGLSTHSLHLSLYWSRLGQRISLPLLISSSTTFRFRTLFWTTFLPFATFAAWELLQQRRRLRASGNKARKGQSTVQQRRADADEFTVLLATPVDGRQKAEREKGGLVILSAKYGVKAVDESNAWGLEEVADVTVALGALVDNGQLHIPSDVHKGNLLGFWDPSPTETKVLHVRYLYQGKEGVVEVVGEEPLRLPTQPIVIDV